MDGALYLNKLESLSPNDRLVVLDKKIKLFKKFTDRRPDRISDRQTNYEHRLLGELKTNPIQEIFLPLPCSFTGMINSINSILNVVLAMQWDVEQHNGKLF